MIEEKGREILDGLKFYGKTAGIGTLAILAISLPIINDHLAQEEVDSFRT